MLHFGRVPAHVGAMVGEDVRLAQVCLAVTEAVPDVGVLGDQSQGLLLAATPDEDRDIARRRRVALGQAARDAGEVFAQQFQP